VTPLRIWTSSLRPLPALAARITFIRQFLPWSSLSRTYHSDARCRSILSCPAASVPHVSGCPVSLIRYIVTANLMTCCNRGFLFLWHMTNVYSTLARRCNGLASRYNISPLVSAPTYSLASNTHAPARQYVLLANSSQYSPVLSNRRARWHLQNRTQRPSSSKARRLSSQRRSQDGAATLSGRRCKPFYHR
jgi:hypothetical protein